MLQPDPQGRNGPMLDEFLKKMPTNRRFANPLSRLIKDCKKWFFLFFFFREHRVETMQRPSNTLHGYRPPNQLQIQPLAPIFRPPQLRYAPPVNLPPPHATSAAGFPPLPGIGLRSVEETEKLRVQLYAVFDHVMVDKILNNHPSEKNIEKLSSYVLDSQHN